MKKGRLLFPAALLPAAILFVAAAGFGTGSDAKGRMVVLISLDGFPAYALNDPRLPVPALRELARRGSWARRMTVTNPTVTWPNHTTLVSGVRGSGHGVLFNGSLVRQPSGEFTVDPSGGKNKLVAGPTLYDLAHARGLTTAQVAWVAIDRAPTIDWAFPEQPKPSDPLIKELARNGVLSASDAVFDSDLADAFHDQVRVRAAEYLIQRYRPNLLLIHLAVIDSTAHQYAPGTLATYNAMALADGCVRELTRFLDMRKGPGFDYAEIIVSDHGFKSYDKEIHLAGVLNATGLNEKVSALAEGGSAMVYFKTAHQTSESARVAGLLRAVPGVAFVAEPAQFQPLGLPNPDLNSQMADLVLYARNGYAFSDAPAQDQISSVTPPRGTHGYMASDPEMDGIFFAAGYGIRKGVTLDVIRNVDVAPAVAQLLGTELPEMDGRVPTEILLGK